MDEIHDLHSDLDVDNVDMYCDVVNTSDEESDEDFDDPTDILLTPGKRIAIRNPEAFTKSKRRSLRSLSDSEFDQKSPSVESSVLHKSPLNSRETQTTSVKSNPPPKGRIKPENFGISETITPFDGVCSPSEIVKRKRRRLSVIIISDDENDASLINRLISLMEIQSAKTPEIQFAFNPKEPRDDKSLKNAGLEVFLTNGKYKYPHGKVVMMHKN
eukprot:786713_1